MALILTRSPYFISNQDYDNGATLTLDIGFYDITGLFSSLQFYSLSFNTQKEIDISPLINGFYSKNQEALVVKTVLNGSRNGQVRPTISNEFITVDGFGYYEDGYNLDLTSYLSSRSLYAGSNDKIQVYSDGIATMPFLSAVSVDTTTVINYLKNGITVSTNTFKIGYNVQGEELLLDGNGNVIQDGNGNDISTQLLIDSLTEAWLTRERIYYASKDLTGLDVDEIQVVFNGNTHSIKVEYIEECKYTPYKLRFRNRYGVLEDLWFFKRTNESLQTERKEFNRVTFDSYKVGDLSRHSLKQYNVNGKESIELNTGWVCESFYENIKQLMLSEEVYIEKNGVDLPINITDSEFRYKTHINDKVINYSINADFAYQKINNIV